METDHSLANPRRHASQFYTFGGNHGTRGKYPLSENFTAFIQWCHDVWCVLYSYQSGHCLDYPRGKLVFGALVGFLVYIIRFYGNYPDGVAFAVLLGNICVPLIDHYTRPRVSGHRQ